MQQVATAVVFSVECYLVNIQNHCNQIFERISVSTNCFRRFEGGQNFSVFVELIEFHSMMR